MFKDTLVREDISPEEIITDRKYLFSKQDVKIEALKQLEDLNSVSQVFGCIMNDPSLYETHKLFYSDFIRDGHKAICEAIVLCCNKQPKKITVDDIVEYISHDIKLDEAFKLDNCLLFLETAVAKSNLDNFEFYYEKLKKLALLRRYKSIGLDVSSIYNPNLEDPTARNKNLKFFNAISLEQLTSMIISEFTKINSDYYLLDTDNLQEAGGEEAMIQKEKFGALEAYGRSYESGYFNEMSKGLRPGKFTIISAATNTGKTRITIANIGKSFIPKLFDFEKLDWIDNPNYVLPVYNKNRYKTEEEKRETREEDVIHSNIYGGCLYIGTEMDPRTELEPILEAYIANVPEDHILSHNYSKKEYKWKDRHNRERVFVNDEEDRVNKAIEYMTNSGIYWAYLPDYGFSTLEQCIAKHVDNYGIKHVFFDYVHVTASLLSEYKRISGAESRDDQVLQFLGNKLKDWSRKYDVSIDTWTQVNGDFGGDLRDQRLIRGCKALADKADLGGILSVPDSDEMEDFESAIKSSSIGLNSKIPTFIKEDEDQTLATDLGEKVLVLSIYKNRNSKYKDVKIVLAVNYSTMRMRDLCVADYNNELLEGVHTVDYYNHKPVYTCNGTIANRNSFESKPDISTTPAKVKEDTESFKQECDRNQIDPDKNKNESMNNIDNDDNISEPQSPDPASTNKDSDSGKKSKLKYYYCREHNLNLDTGAIVELTGYSSPTSIQDTLNLLNKDKSGDKEFELSCKQRRKGKQRPKVIHISKPRDDVGYAEKDFIKDYYEDIKP